MAWKMLFIFILPSWGLAEYRAFNLIFKDQDSNIVRSLASNLDPDQYRAFYPVANDIVIQYVDTWMCFGRTNEMPICANPKLSEADKAIDQNPQTP